MTFISSEIKTQRTFLMRKALNCIKISKKRFRARNSEEKKLVHTLEHPYGTAL